ncbi:DUF4190 domain-containing protein [Desulfosarcina sp.]|nr:DUF4190 domain-containing protein [Desulfosarcina sp.]
MADEIQNKPIPSQPVENKTSGKAIASLVLGIASIFIGWIPILGWAAVILALVFGFGALKQIKHNPKIEGKGMAIAGIIMGFIGLIPILFGLIWMISMFGVLNSSMMI